MKMKALAVWVNLGGEYEDSGAVVFVPEVAEAIEEALEEARRTGRAVAVNVPRGSTAGIFLPEDALDQREEGGVLLGALRSGEEEALALKEEHFRVLTGLAEKGGDGLIFSFGTVLPNGNLGLVLSFDRAVRPRLVVDAMLR